VHERQPAGEKETDGELCFSSILFYIHFQYSVLWVSLFSYIIIIIYYYYLFILLKKKLEPQY